MRKRTKLLVMLAVMLVLGIGLMATGHAAAGAALAGSTPVLGMAMASNDQYLVPTEGTDSAATRWSYPTTTQVFLLQNQNGQVHLLIGSDATPVTNHNSAPVGSIYIVSAAGTGAGQNLLWIKTPTAADVAAGLIIGPNDGVWKEFATAN